MNSAVRRQYLPYARVVGTGVWQIYGAVPLTSGTRPLFDERMFGIFTVVRGPEGTFVGVAPVEFPVSPRGAGGRVGVELLPVADYMTCSFGARSEWFGGRDLRAISGDQLHALVAGAVEGWHPRVRDIVAACVPGSMFALPLRSSVPVGAWAATSVTLLGDAIHAMSPAAGAGACVVLRDAVRLVDVLTQGGRDLVAAVGDYEAAMRDYGFAAVREGAVNGERFLVRIPCRFPDATRTSGRSPVGGGPSQSTAGSRLDRTRVCVARSGTPRPAVPRSGGTSLCPRSR